MGARSSERQRIASSRASTPALLAHRPGLVPASDGPRLRAGLADCRWRSRRRAVGRRDASRLDVVIAGVNKAGTTSLFVSLSEHPQVAPSAVKETRFFLPARYGKPVAPVDVYDEYFTVAPETPGPARGDAVATSTAARRSPGVIDETLPDARIIVVLREPVAAHDLVLPVPEDPAADPGRPLDRGLPRARRHARPTRTSSIRRTSATSRSAGAATPTSCPRWLEVFGPTGCSSSTSRSSPRDPARVLRETATWLGLDPLLLPADALVVGEPDDGVQEPRFQRVALDGERPVRADPPPLPRA